LAVVFAATLGVAQAAADKREVVLQFDFGNGATPQVRIDEGGTGTIEFPDASKLGFVPTIQDSTVSIDVFDERATPRRHLTYLEAVIGGDSVQSTTTKPQFAVRVVRVVTGAQP
jgi:hypothetical protein